MTIRDSLNRDLARIRREQLLAAFLFFPSLALLAYFQCAGGSHVKIPALMLLVSLALMAHVLMRVKREVRCSACSKSLGRTMFDVQSTSNNFAVLLFYAAFPESVTQCPHCHESLDDDSENTAAS